MPVFVTLYKTTLYSTRSLKRNIRRSANTSGHVKLERSKSQRSKSSGYLLQNLFVSIPKTKGETLENGKITESSEHGDIHGSSQKPTLETGVKSQGNSRNSKHKIKNNENKPVAGKPNNTQVTFTERDNGLVNYATPKFMVNNATYANEWRIGEKA